MTEMPNRWWEPSWEEAPDEMEPVDYEIEEDLPF